MRLINSTSIDIADYQELHNCTLIFTDGSKSAEGSTGSGWAIFHCQNPGEPICEKVRISDHASVFQAEIFAIFSASSSLLASSEPINKVTHFFSDSKSALHALCNHHPSSILVINTIKSLNSLGSSSHVTLHWVRGHTGVAGNELADTLAKEATSMDTIDAITPAPPSYYKTLIRSWSFSQSKKSFETTPTTNKLHQLVLSLHRPESSSTSSKYSTAELHKLSNILSNRAPLNAYLFRINKSSTDLCPRCLIEPEDNVHFLCHCPFFYDLRSSTFGFPVITIPALSNLKLTKILTFIKNSDIFQPPFNS